MLTKKSYNARINALRAISTDGPRATINVTAVTDLAHQQVVVDRVRAGANVSEAALCVAEEVGDVKLDFRLMSLSRRCRAQDADATWLDQLAGLRSPDEVVRTYPRFPSRNGWRRSGSRCPSSRTPRPASTRSSPPARTCWPAGSSSPWSRPA